MAPPMEKNECHPRFLITFSFGNVGAWRVDRISPVTGDSLPAATRLGITEGTAPKSPSEATWALRGITSNTRYTNRSELDVLAARQEDLARPLARCAALIPIRKTDAWWTLAQDERRAIFEEKSRHIGIGLDYLPAIARRLHHCRELGESFDFVTWFEYAPEDADAFEDLVRRLRATEEWRYINREVDIRLCRD